MVFSASSSSMEQPSSKLAHNFKYNVFDDQWYKSYPYRLEADFLPDVLNKIPVGTIGIDLPISPNNLTITTQMATNVISTLYGVVEEHSDIKFYDIVIQGNTGIAPVYFDGGKYGGKYVSLPNTMSTIGKQSFNNFALNLGGFLPEVTGTINQAMKTFSAIKNTIGSIFGGDEDGNETGVDNSVSGYKAFHNIYNFLHMYKKSRASGNKARSSLRFYNFKDNNIYDCVPVSFTMVRSADNPMIYNYNIRLRGFNLRPLFSYFRIGKNDANLLEQMGLDGFGGSVFSKITSVASNVNTLANTVSQQ